MLDLKRNLNPTLRLLKPDRIGSNWLSSIRQPQFERALASLIHACAWKNQSCARYNIVLSSPHETPTFYDYNPSAQVSIASLVSLAGQLLNCVVPRPVSSMSLIHPIYMTESCIHDGIMHVHSMLPKFFSCSSCVTSDLVLSFWQAS